jgi:hypothetical protein
MRTEILWSCAILRAKAAACPKDAKTCADIDVPDR